VAQENPYRNTQHSQTWICWASYATKTTPVAGSRHTYAIQPSSSSSILRWTPRAATSRATKVALLTWSQCSGSVTFLYLVSSNWQRTGNWGVWRAPWVWRISQQHLNKQLLIVAFADMRQHQLALSALTVVELVLRTSVSAVIFVSTYDRTTTTSVERHRRNGLTT